MAPAQQDVHICGDAVQSQIKMRLMDSDNKSDSEVKCENNNPVLPDSRDKIKSDTDFDVSKYEAMEFRARIKWPDLIVQLALHLVSIYGFYLILTFQVRFFTILFGKYHFCLCTYVCATKELTVVKAQRHEFRGKFKHFQFSLFSIPFQNISKC